MASDPPARFAELDQHLQDLMAKTGAPGLAIAIFDSENTLFERHYGWRDREAELPVTPDTIFGVASVTKSFTALTVLAQEAAGRLELSDRVSTHLPLALPGEPTLEHLLTHSSGLPPAPTMTWLRVASQLGDPVAEASTLAEAKLTLVTGAMGVEPGVDWRDVSCGELDLAAGQIADDEARRRCRDLAEMVSSADGLCGWLQAHAAPLFGAPGEVYSYSNDSFALSGHIVERVSGRLFEEEVERAVLAPIGMGRTTFDVDRVLEDADHTTLYTRDAGGHVRRSPQWQTTGRMLGGGMLKSTTNDLKRYVRYLMAPQRLSAPVPAQRVIGMRAGLVRSGPDERYGLGLAETRLGNVTVVSHSGSLKGVSSVIGFSPELGVGVVGLCNLDGVPISQVLYPALNACMGSPLETLPYEPEEFHGSEQEALELIAELVGEYRSGEPYGRLVIEAEGATATAKSGAPTAVQAPAMLIRRGELSLRLPMSNSAVTAFRDAGGAVVGVLAGSRVLWRTGLGAASG